MTALTTPSKTSSLEARYCEEFPRSAKLHAEGRQIFPNGVTHDGRYMQPFPVYIDRAEGSRKYDLEGHTFIDYWMGHGSLILGHSHPAIVEAVQKQVERGTHLGSCHEEEMEWGRWVQRLIPSAERLRFVNSGTEATLMALRISRIVTGRQKVLKFAGHFHGWHDLLIPAADGPYDTGTYATPGVTDSVLGDLVVLPPNDVAAVERAITEHNPACLIVEGNGGHWGAVPMRAEFLRSLRDLTKKTGVIFIMDEVITGFRISPGGAQAEFGVVPDMTSMAKILAGGLPGGCLAGRADLLNALEFDNPHGKKMKHPGTYNGNPLSAVAGSACLEIVATGEPCRIANEMAKKLRCGLNALFAEKQVNWIAYGDYSACNILPEYDGPRSDRDDFIPYDNRLEKLDRKFDPVLSRSFRQAQLLSGIDLFGGWRCMLSGVHTAADIDQTVAAFDSALDLLRADGKIA